MDERIEALLSRKILGTVTPDEERELRTWMEAHPEEARQVRTLLEVFRPVPGAHDDQGVEEAWRRVRSRIDVGSTPRPTGRETGPEPFSLARRLRRASPALLRIAAVLVVGLGGTILADAWLDRGVMGVATVVDREVRTERGERRPVVLPDGSRVTLAPESRLSYRSAFPHDARSVELEGRGFFDVASDPDRPFRVRTARARVAVLGTRFDLRAYPEEGDAQVAVQEGSVSLEGAGPVAGEAVVLEGGDLGRLETGSDTPIRSRGGADERHFGWTEGHLVFRDTPLSSVLSELSRFYDIDFSAPDELLVRRVSFSIDDQPRAQVLELLSLLLDLRVRTRGDIVRLDPRNGTP